jgi:hypothetical protein
MLNPPLMKFFIKKNKKLSVVENLDYLIQSTKPISLALQKNKLFF